MQPSALAKRVWLLLFLAVIAFYYYGLGHMPFVGPDEPRYAQVAREMFLRGDLVTPTLGGHTWFEKPPLLYWMMIASFHLFGISEWAARLGPALSGLLTVFAVFWTGRRVCRASIEHQLPGLAPWSAIIAASTLGIIVFSRGVGFDIVVTMTIAWALSFFLVSELEENEEICRRFLFGFYVFIGLSLLAKGLIGLVIPFSVVGFYQLVRRQFPARSFLLSLWWGLPLLFVVASSWYVPVILKHGWPFIDEFFIQHHFKRYFSNKYLHPQPFYFYLLILIPLSLPWTAFLIEGLVEARTWKLRSPDSLDRLRIFALAWLLMPLAFFSLSGSKLPGYILPVLPAGALIAGERLTKLLSGDRDGFWAMRITGAVSGMFAIVGSVYLIRLGSLSLKCVAMMGVPLIITAASCIFWTHRKTVSALLVIFATFAALIVALNCGVRSIATRESMRDLIQLANARGYGSAPVYALHQIDRSAEFYAAGRVVYASEGEPARFESALDILEASRKNRAPILVIVPIEYIHQLTGLPSALIDVVGNNGKLALVGVASQESKTDFKVGCFSSD
ncbi:MAG: glycosyltransferase family 39 protein [Pyrinomonadaceae bacterium]|nr:glycosyltransferase family 39 protein [Pyrinomonadaceae bacterium]